MGEDVESQHFKGQRYFIVWEWKDAPKEFTALSPHMGDEDWVALEPPDDGPRQAYEGWLDHLGVSEVSVHELPNGYTVYIGAHA